MNIALIGPPGVGKGTHAHHLREQYKPLYLATGDLLRENLENRTAIGFLARKNMVQGLLVSDDVVDAMIAEWLWQTPDDQSILLDGFPKTILQAQFLDEILEELQRGLDLVIFLDSPDAQIEDRLKQRMVCDDCQASYHLTHSPPAEAGRCDSCEGKLQRRFDDIPELIKVRLRTFRRAVKPVLEYYQESGRLVIVDASGQIPQITAQVAQIVDALALGKPLRKATWEETAQVAGELGIVRAVTAGEATHDSFDLVLVGGPGSGKGTQAEQLRDLLDLPHIATGDLFRENLKNETDLGKLAKTYMDKGSLVPDDITEAMVEERIARTDTAKGFILDGFPRSIGQAEALTQILNAQKRRLNAVLYIRVSNEEIVKRLSGRWICRECQTPFHLMFKPPVKAGICDGCGGALYQRTDDNAKTIRNRLKTFNAQTGPIIDYYKENGILIEIDGEGAVMDVKKRTREAVEALKR